MAKDFWPRKASGISGIRIKILIVFIVIVTVCYQGYFLVLDNYQSLFDGHDDLIVKFYRLDVKRSVGQERFDKICNAPKPVMDRYMRLEYGLPKGVYKPKMGCPGADDIDPGYGNFDFNGLKFRIPRDILWTHSKQADGPTNAINASLSPEEFGIQQTTVKKKINFYLRSRWSTEICDDTDCISDMQYFYMNNFIRNKIFHVKENLSSFSQKIKDYPWEMINESLGLKRLVVSKGLMSESDIYFTGSKEKPDFWYRCRRSGGCEYRHWKFPNIYYEVTFSERDFEKSFFNIAPKIIKKIDSYIVE